MTIGLNTTTTYYVRDAQGNVMAVYEKQAANPLRWTEQHLYGSSRLGMWAFGQTIPAGTTAPAVGSALEDGYIYGTKFFELSNHLGNVLATVSDKKIGVDDGSNGTTDYFTAEVLSAQDYYPFGMAMPGRKFTRPGGSAYRYGFNGKENDNEVKGEGNQQDYGMRIYDPRLGKFLSVDPLSKSFAWYSPYQFAGNIPIAAIDLDGEEQKIMINWRDVNGNVTRTKIVKADFEIINKLYQSLSKGLNNETTYTLEGTKFNATNSKFSSGFETYKKGTGNPRNPYAPSIRPSNGVLKFDISTDKMGGQSVNITFDNSPINERELIADALRGFGKVANTTGTVIEGAGYVSSFVPGGQTVGLPLIGIGKGISASGDVIEIVADLSEGKKQDAAIKTGFFIGGQLVGYGANKLPVIGEGSKQALDTYGSRGIGAVKDGYFSNRPQKIEESDKIDLKIEQKR